MVRRKVLVLVTLVAVLALAMPVDAVGPPRQQSTFQAFWNLIYQLIPQFGTPQKSEEGPGLDPNGQDAADPTPPSGLLSLPPDGTGTLAAPDGSAGSPGDPYGQETGSSVDPNGLAFKAPIAR